MSHSSIVRWIVGVCTSLRLSQRKTLGELVFGAMRCRRVSLADIGRSMSTRTTVKHNIKRVYRFLKNHRVEAADACGALMCLGARAGTGRLFVAVDWVDVGQYKLLRGAVPLGGRSVPILFAAYRKWQLHKSQNAFEEGFFRLLAAIAPDHVELVVLADRGFGRAELARTLQKLGVGYIIRVGLMVNFSSEKYCGLLYDLPVRWGTHKDLGFGSYRKSRPVRQRVIVYWKRPHKEPWFVVTSLDWGWRKVSGAFGLRMKIEELFRDEKNLRYGWGLRQLSLSEPERLERMLLVLAFAYLLVLLVGIRCQQQLPQSHWAAASGKRRQASAFFVGRYMQGRARFSLRRLLRLLATALAAITEENWG